jgi:hypothetical protein
MFEPRMPEVRLDPGTAGRISASAQLVGGFDRLLPTQRGDFALSKTPEETILAYYHRESGRMSV